MKANQTGAGARESGCGDLVADAVLLRRWSALRSWAGRASSCLKDFKSKGEAVGRAVMRPHLDALAIGDATGWVAVAGRPIQMDMTVVARQACYAVDQGSRLGHRPRSLQTAVRNVSTRLDALHARTQAEAETADCANESERKGTPTANTTGPDS